MASNKAISVFRAAVGMLATVKLTSKEEGRIEKLAEELKAILDEVVARNKASQNP